MTRLGPSPPCPLVHKRPASFCLRKARVESSLAEMAEELEAASAQAVSTYQRVRSCDRLEGPFHVEEPISNEYISPDTRSFVELQLSHGNTVIVSNEENKYLPQGYHLSAIGDMPGARTPSRHLLAGRDRAAAWLGGVRENSETLPVSPVRHPFLLGLPEEAPVEGYVLHSRCWDLLELRLGLEASLRLDLITGALEPH
jgi:hypothetical protein